MPGNVRLWGLAVAAFGAGAATLGVGGAFLRNTSRQELRLYPPGVELSTVAGVSIRRNASSYGDDRPESALMWMSPRSVPDIIREIEEEPRIEVLEETRLPQGKFDIHCLPPREQPAVLQTRMRDAVSRAFGIAWTREKQRQHVYVLRSVPGVVLGFEAHPGGNGSVSSSSDESGFSMSFLGLTIDALAKQLGNGLHVRVIDETGLTGTWQGDLRWGPDPEALAGALREKGLDLAPGGPRCRRDRDSEAVREPQPRVPGEAGRTHVESLCRAKERRTRAARHGRSRYHKGLRRSRDPRGSGTARRDGDISGRCRPPEVPTAQRRASRKFFPSSPSVLLAGDVRVLIEEFGFEKTPRGVFHLASPRAPRATPAEVGLSRKPHVGFFYGSPELDLHDEKPNIGPRGQSRDRGLHETSPPRSTRASTSRIRNGSNVPVLTSSGRRAGVDILKKLWASPSTLVGIVLGGAGLLFRRSPRPRLANNAIEFYGNPIVGLFTPAVTLGNAILYAEEHPSPYVQEHERQHTYQAEVLGPAYLPLHIAFQLAAFAYSFFDRSRVYRDLNDRVHSPANLLETGPSRDRPTPWWW